MSATQNVKSPSRMNCCRDFQVSKDQIGTKEEGSQTHNPRPTLLSSDAVHVADAVT